MELTKEHFDQQMQEMKSYIHQSFEAQQGYIDERLVELTARMQIQERLARHDSWLHAVADKVGIKLSN